MDFTSEFIPSVMAQLTEKKKTKLEFLILNGFYLFIPVFSFLYITFMQPCCSVEAKYCHITVTAKLYLSSTVPA